MASYTIEDIELIRSKSGITYQEAVSLLDYHNGNVARALVDLERNGRLKPEAARQHKAAAPRAKSGAAGKPSSNRYFFLELLSALYRARIKVRKDETTIINLSALFSILAVIVAPHLVIFGAIISLVLGYKFSFSRSDNAFAGENLERMVRNAADNVKSSVGDLARSFQGSADSAAEEKTAEEAPEQKSYYTARPTATASYRPDVPTLNVPVQVESQDGSVTVEGDNEGYTNATIE